MIVATNIPIKLNKIMNKANFLVMCLVVVPLTFFVDLFLSLLSLTKELMALENLLNEPSLGGEDDFLRRPSVELSKLGALKSSFFELSLVRDCKSVDGFLPFRFGSSTILIIYLC